LRRDLIGGGTVVDGIVGDLALELVFKDFVPAFRIPNGTEPLFL
jgi:hypothetical protein